jgi:hypothetical protein
MQLAKLTMLKRINVLRGFLATVLVFICTAFSSVFGQDNSPYSRYGIGDLVPPTNTVSRSLGGISAGYADFLSINFNNPASYTSFESVKEMKSKKQYAGRTLIDIGMNFESRTLREPATSKKFTASNALFSYVQVGMPLSAKWGLSFGLRPISRISYKMYRSERLINPIAPFNPIDSALTRFEGDGGSYLASVGTGVALFKKEKFKMEEKLSIGINGGYLFGEKNYSTKRTLLNDSVEYKQANYETKTNYGNLYFNAGIQYKLPVKKNMILTIGAFGNWGQTMNASQDIIRETFDITTQGEVRVDSVSDQKNVKGKIEMPSSYTVGFVLQKYSGGPKEGSWLIGVDFNQQNWDKYRFYGQTDAVQNKWEVKVGAQITPAPKIKSYFSNVAYRFGLFTGPDYINVGSKLNQFGGSFGVGLPMRRNVQVPNAISLINLSFEYIKRGNNDNVLKENLFRFSLGLSLSDLWFIKRKYD